MTVVFKAENVNKHRDLTDKIKETLVYDDATFKEAESHSAYHANLPEDISRKQVEELGKYNTKFVTATHIAVGELAAEIFQKEKRIHEITASIGYFGKTDNIDITISRSKVYQNHLAENNADKEVTKHLVMKTTVTSQSAKGYGLKSIRESMSDEFADMFKK
jgi:hypothetical protein